MKIFDFVLRFVSHKYFFSPVTFTFIFFWICSSPYQNNQNFDLITTFFGSLSFASLLLLCVFLHHLLLGKKELVSLFAQCFSSFLLNSMALTFTKSYSFFNKMSFFVGIAAIFCFFNIFKDLATQLVKETKKDELNKRA